MSSNGDISGKKRARTDMTSATSSGMKNSTEGGKRNASRSCGCFDVNERTEALSTKLLSLYDEFPEMNFIVNSQKMQTHVATAVKKYKDAIIKHAESEAKKREAQALVYREEETVPLYSLPDEVLQNCLSYVGKGYFGIVALASKKLRKAYIVGFGKETKYLEMATSIKLVNLCLSTLCKTSEEKDEILKAAAVNGHLDILRYAVSEGYDLFPLVEMKSETVYQYEDGTYGDHDEDEHGPYCEYGLEEISKEVYYTDEDQKSTWGGRKVKLSQLVAKGHLDVLKYLHDELNYRVGFQRYCRPAIQHGKVEIMEWLHAIGCMNPYDAMHELCMDQKGKCRPFNFYLFAIKCGSVEALEWLLNKGFELEDDIYVMEEAIRSKSVEMIDYCFDLGFNFQAYGVQEAIRETKNLEVYRKVHELGYDFKEMKKWYNQRQPWDIKDSFEIIKYLSSVSTQWTEKVMLDIVEYGTLEMIRFAHENGCPWSSSEVIYALLSRHDFCHEKFNYLMEIGCQIEFDRSVVNRLRGKKDLDLLELFVGKNTTLDNALFKKMVECPPWLEGVTYVLENGKDIQNFASIEEVFEICRTIDGLKYFHSLGLPWCIDTSRNALVLCEIACFNELDDVKWAYENGCKGGPCLNEEKVKPDFRKRKPWKVNRTFLEENAILAPMNIQEIGDAELQSKYSSRDSMFFTIDYPTLKSLVDRGYAFRSQSEKESITKEALEKCMNHVFNGNERKRLALFQKMGVSQSSYSN